MLAQLLKHSDTSGGLTAFARLHLLMKDNIWSLTYMEHLLCESAGESSAGKPQLSVLYKYKEGFTNAVKRPVMMTDLL